MDVQSKSQENENKMYGKYESLAEAQHGRRQTIVLKNSRLLVWDFLPALMIDFETNTF